MHVEHVLADKGRKIVTIGPDLTLAEAVATLNTYRIGAVVVVEDGDRVVGIVSERDVIRALAETGAAALDDKVSARMTRKVVTCTASATLLELMGIMTEGKFRHIPVVEREHLVGIVSIGDAVKHRLAEVEAEHEALKDYVASA